MARNITLLAHNCTVCTSTVQFENRQSLLTHALKFHRSIVEKDLKAPIVSGRIKIQYDGSHGLYRCVCCSYETIHRFLIEEHFRQHLKNKTPYHCHCGALISGRDIFSHAESKHVGQEFNIINVDNNDIVYKSLAQVGPGCGQVCTFSTIKKDHTVNVIVNGVGLSPRNPIVLNDDDEPVSARAVRPRKQDVRQAPQPHIISVNDGASTSTGVRASSIADKSSDTEGNASTDQLPLVIANVFSVAAIDDEFIEDTSSAHSLSRISCSVSNATTSQPLPKTSQAASKASSTLPLLHTSAPSSTTSSVAAASKAGQLSVASLTTATSSNTGTVNSCGFVSTTVSHSVCSCTVASHVSVTPTATVATSTSMVTDVATGRSESSAVNMTTTAITTDIPTTNKSDTVVASSAVLMTTAGVSNCSVSSSNVTITMVSETTDRLVGNVDGQCAVNQSPLASSFNRKVLSVEERREKLAELLRTKAQREAALRRKRKPYRKMLLVGQFNYEIECGFICLNCDYVHKSLMRFLHHVFRDTHPRKYCNHRIGRDGQPVQDRQCGIICAIREDLLKIVRDRKKRQRRAAQQAASAASVGLPDDAPQSLPSGTGNVNVVSASVAEDGNSAGSTADIATVLHAAGTGSCQLHSNFREILLSALAASTNNSSLATPETSSSTSSSSSCAAPSCSAPSSSVFSTAAPLSSALSTSASVTSSPAADAAMFREAAVLLSAEASSGTGGYSEDMSVGCLKGETIVSLASKASMSHLATPDTTSSDPYQFEDLSKASTSVTGATNTNITSANDTRCQLCSFVSASHHQLKVHARVEHNMRLCDECPYTVSATNKQAMPEHKLMHVKVKALSEYYKCSTCHYINVSSTNVKKHYAKVHNKTSRDVRNGRIVRVTRNGKETPLNDTAALKAVAPRMASSSSSSTPAGSVIRPPRPAPAGTTCASAGTTSAPSSKPSTAAMSKPAIGTRYTEVNDASGKVTFKCSLCSYATLQKFAMNRHQEANHTADATKSVASATGSVGTQQQVHGAGPSQRKVNNSQPATSSRASATVSNAANKKTVLVPTGDKHKFATSSPSVNKHRVRFADASLKTSPLKSTTSSRSDKKHGKSATQSSAAEPQRDEANSAYESDDSLDELLDPSRVEDLLASFSYDPIHELYQCRSCVFMNKNVRIVIRHVKEKHINRMKYTCAHCNQVDRRCADICLHLRTHHADLPQSFSITSAVRMGAVLGHSAPKKSDITVELTGERGRTLGKELEEFVEKSGAIEYTCLLCKETVTPPLKYHFLARHLNVKQFQCNYCKESFENIDKAKSHLLVQHSDLPCHVCCHQVDVANVLADIRSQIKSAPSGCTTDSAESTDRQHSTVMDYLGSPRESPDLSLSPLFAGKRSVDGHESDNDNLIGFNRPIKRRLSSDSDNTVDLNTDFPVPKKSAKRSDSLSSGNNQHVKKRRLETKEGADRKQKHSSKNESDKVSKHACKREHQSSFTLSHAKAKPDGAMAAKIELKDTKAIPWDMESKKYVGGSTDKQIEFTLRCDVCSHRHYEKSKQLMMRHIRVEHQNTPRFWCTWCDDCGFELLSDVRVHFATVHHGKEIDVRDMDKEMHDELMLDFCLRKCITTRSVTYTCSECGHEENSCADFEEHILSKHWQYYKYECLVCARAFVSERNVRAHLADDHEGGEEFANNFEESKRAALDELVLKCQKVKCTSTEETGTAAEMMEYLSINTPGSDTDAEVKETRKSPANRKHKECVQEGRSIRPISKTCPHCPGWKFSSKYALKVHREYVHHHVTNLVRKNEIVIYECVYCKKYCRDQKQFSAHLNKYHVCMVTHGSAYQCVRCSFSHNSLKAVQDHVTALHVPSVPYVLCLACNKKVSRGMLHRHRRRMHPEDTNVPFVVVKCVADNIKSEMPPPRNALTSPINGFQPLVYVNWMSSSEIRAKCNNIT